MALKGFAKFMQHQKKAVHAGTCLSGTSIFKYLQSVFRNETRCKQLYEAGFKELNANVDMLTCSQ